MDKGYDNDRQQNDSERQSVPHPSKKYLGTEFFSPSKDMTSKHRK